MTFENFQFGEIQKPKKIDSTSANIKYSSYLEGFLTTSKS